MSDAVPTYFKEQQGGKRGKSTNKNNKKSKNVLKGMSLTSSQEEGFQIAGVGVATTNPSSALNNIDISTSFSSKGKSGKKQNYDENDLILSNDLISSNTENPSSNDGIQTIIPLSYWIDNDNNMKLRKVNKSTKKKSATSIIAENQFINSGVSSSDEEKTIMPSSLDEDNNDNNIETKTPKSYKNTKRSSSKTAPTTSTSTPTSVTSTSTSTTSTSTTSTSTSTTTSTTNPSWFDNDGATESPSDELSNNMNLSSTIEWNKNNDNTSITRKYNRSSMDEFFQIVSNETNLLSEELRYYNTTLTSEIDDDEKILHTLISGHNKTELKINNNKTSWGDFFGNHNKGPTVSPVLLLDQHANSTSNTHPDSHIPQPINLELIDAIEDASHDNKTLNEKLDGPTNVEASGSNVNSTTSNLQYAAVAVGSVGLALLLVSRTTKTCVSERKVGNKSEVIFFPSLNDGDASISSGKSHNLHYAYLEASIIDDSSQTSAPKKGFQNFFAKSRTVTYKMPSKSYKETVENYDNVKTSNGGFSRFGQKSNQRSGSYGLSQGRNPSSHEKKRRSMFRFAKSQPKDDMHTLLPVDDIESAMARGAAAAMESEDTMHLSNVTKHREASKLRIHGMLGLEEVQHKKASVVQSSIDLVNNESTSPSSINKKEDTLTLKPTISLGIKSIGSDESTSPGSIDVSNIELNEAENMSSKSIGGQSVESVESTSPSLIVASNAELNETEYASKLENSNEMIQSNSSDNNSVGSDESTSTISINASIIELNETENVFKLENNNGLIRSLSLGAQLVESDDSTSPRSIDELDIELNETEYLPIPKNNHEVIHSKSFGAQSVGGDESTSPSLVDGSNVEMNEIEYISKLENCNELIQSNTLGAQSVRFDALCNLSDLPNLCVIRSNTWTDEMHPSTPHKNVANLVYSLKSKSFDGMSLLFNDFRPNVNVNCLDWKRSSRRLVTDPTNESSDEPKCENKYDKGIVKMDVTQDQAQLLVRFEHQDFKQRRTIVSVDEQLLKTTNIHRKVFRLYPSQRAPFRRCESWTEYLSSPKIELDDSSFYIDRCKSSDAVLETTKCHFKSRHLIRSASFTLVDCSNLSSKVDANNDELEYLDPDIRNGFDNLDRLLTDMIDDLNDSDQESDNDSNSRGKSDSDNYSNSDDTDLEQYRTDVMLETYSDHSFHQDDVFSMDDCNVNTSPEGTTSMVDPRLDVISVPIGSWNSSSDSIQTLDILYVEETHSHGENDSYTDYWKKTQSLLPISTIDVPFKNDDDLDSVSVLTEQDFLITNMLQQKKASILPVSYDNQQIYEENKERSNLPQGLEGKAIQTIEMLSVPSFPNNANSNLIKATINEIDVRDQKNSNLKQNYLATSALSSEPSSMMFSTVSAEMIEHGDVLEIE